MVKGSASALLVACTLNYVCIALIDREPRTVIHVKRAKRFDPMG